MRRFSTVIGLVVAIVLGIGPAAMACGFLVSANGAVNLLRTTTLVAWEDGVEHYVTNFAFEGEASSFGSLIPLPAEPTDVKRAGDWTLQRLVREITPQPSFDAFADGAVLFSVGEAEVILQTRIDSLDVVVLKGGGAEVLRWVNANGFNLPEGPETDHMLEYYSSRSPYWLAARFDADAAIADGFQSGDGVPVQITIPTERPWVPLHILHGAAPDTEIIEADVFLLTPERPRLLHGLGLKVNRSEPASDLLLDDLRSDVDMEWVPTEAWFTHLDLEVEARHLVYDLSVGVGDVRPSMVDAGYVEAGRAYDGSAPVPGGMGRGTLLLLGGVAAATVVVAGRAVRRAGASAQPANTSSM